MKKLLSIALCCVLTISMIPTVAFANNEDSSNILDVEAYIADTFLEDVSDINLNELTNEVEYLSDVAIPIDYLVDIQVNSDENTYVYNLPNEITAEIGLIENELGKGFKVDEGNGESELIFGYDGELYLDGFQIVIDEMVTELNESQKMEIDRRMSYNGSYAYNTQTCPYGKYLIITIGLQQNGKRM